MGEEVTHIHLEQQMVQTETSEHILVGRYVSQAFAHMSEVGSCTREGFILKLSFMRGERVLKKGDIHLHGV